jgi:hypothetical protein
VNAKYELHLSGFRADIVMPPHYQSHLYFEELADEGVTDSIVQFIREIHDVSSCDKDE